MRTCSSARIKLLGLLAASGLFALSIVEPAAAESVARANKDRDAAILLSTSAQGRATSVARRPGATLVVAQTSPIHARRCARYHVDKRCPGF